MTVPVAQRLDIGKTSYIIARSNESKALGIKMGQPVFECRELIEQHDIQVFSSNYALYADVSHRIMSILATFSSHIEVYSIVMESTKNTVSKVSKED